MIVAIIFVVVVVVVGGVVVVVVVVGFSFCCCLWCLGGSWDGAHAVVDGWCAGFGGGSCFVPCSSSCGWWVCCWLVGFVLCPFVGFLLVSVGCCWLLLLVEVVVG